MSAEDYFDVFDCPEEEDSYPCGGYRRRLLPSIPGVPNHGAYWTDAQDRKLAKAFRADPNVGSLAKLMGRTEVSITYRLHHLGLTEDQSKFALATTNDRKVTTKKVNPMHTDMLHLLALLQEGYTTIQVVFQDGLSKEYTYKVPLTMGVVKGDLVVVPTRTIFSVAKVKEVHDSPKINVKEPLALRWVVQRVDSTQYDDQTRREQEAIETLEQAERAKAQREALDALLGTTDRQALMALINPK